MLSCSFDVSIIIISVSEIGYSLLQKISFLGNLQRTHNKDN
jgi:hypothetical protein